MGKRSKRRRRQYRELLRNPLTYAGGRVYGYMNFPERSLTFAESFPVGKPYLLYRGGAIMEVQEVSYAFEYTGS